MDKFRANNADDRDLWKRIKPALRGKDKSPCPDELFLASYLDGKLSGKQTALFEEHLLNCESCSEAVGELRGLMQEKPIEPSEGVLRGAKKLVDAPAKNNYTVVFRFPRLSDAYSPGGAVRLALSTAFVVVICIAAGLCGQKTSLNHQLTVGEIASDVSFGMSDYTQDSGYL